MTLQESIKDAINMHNAEVGSNTPDFILAAFLMDCLAAFNKATIAREIWYGRGCKSEIVKDPPAPSNPLLEELKSIQVKFENSARNLPSAFDPNGDARRTFRVCADMLQEVIDRHTTVKTKG